MKKFTFRVYTSNQWARLNVCHIDEYSLIEVYGADGLDAYTQAINKYDDCHVVFHGSIIERMDFMEAIGYGF